jgi:hypothetical protein
MEKNQSVKPSEGEEYIADFFKDVGIKYEFQKEIPSLKFDVKQFRKADFYLPRYKVYVEFFGLWNNNGNEDYRIKKQVYKQNDIPCVYLYPENLGIIEYTFDKRIQAELKKHHLKEELRKYHFHKLRRSSELWNRIGIAGLALGVIFYKLISNSQKMDEFVLIGAMLLIVLFQTYWIRDLYRDIFKRNKFYLSE